jgi:hypothetical protein
LNPQTFKPPVRLKAPVAQKHQSDSNYRNSAKSI